MRVSELAQHAGGVVQGDASFVVETVSPLDDIQSGSLVFVFSEKQMGPAVASSAGVIVLPHDISLPKSSQTFIQVTDPRQSMARILPCFDQCKRLLAPGVHETAVLGNHVRLGRDVHIGAHCVVGDNVTIGDNTILYPHVTIYSETVLGARVLLHSGTVIGADGFGYVRDNGRVQKIPQIGCVII